MRLIGRLKLHWQDTLHNHLFAKSPSRFLVVRGRKRHPFINEAFFHWLMATRPGAISRFSVCHAPARVPRGPFDLFIPWVQDPLHVFEPKLYQCMLRWQAHFDRLGVPTINRIEHLANSVKSTCLGKLAAAGLNVPAVQRIDDVQAFQRDGCRLSMPYFVRDDGRHGGPVFLIREQADLAGIRWDQLQQPVAIAYVDVRGDDGLYRKYRAFTVGEQTLPRHMIASRNWFVHAADRVQDAAAREEECAHIAGDEPNHAMLQTARQALGFDFAAFDYSYMPDGRMIIWEANPLPTIQSYPYQPAMDYHLDCLGRIYLAMLQLYVQRAEAAAAARAL